MNATITYEMRWCGKGGEDPAWHIVEVTAPSLGKPSWCIVARFEDMTHAERFHAHLVLGGTVEPDPDTVRAFAAEKGLEVNS